MRLEKNHPRTHLKKNMQPPRAAIVLRHRPFVPVGTAQLAEAISIPVVLSGGMHSHEDLAAAAKLEEKGVKGVILGRSIYEGTIDLVKAVAEIQNEGDTL